VGTHSLKRARAVALDDGERECAIRVCPTGFEGPPVVIRKRWRTRLESLEVRWILPRRSRRTGGKRSTLD